MNADQEKSSQSGAQSNVPLQYLSRVNPPPMPRPGFWAFVIGVCGGLIGFGCWCLIDFMDVRYGPARAEQFYLLWLVAIVIVFAWPAVVFRNLDDRQRVGLIMAVVLGAAMFAGILILGVGPLFHVAIGGRM